MRTFPRIASVIAACTAAASLFAFAPTTAMADESIVTATKSFPTVSTTRENLTAESTSTEVEGDSSWGGIETLNVPQTASQAEKDAAAAEAAQKIQDEAAAAQVQSQMEAASRGQARSTMSYTELDGSVSAGAAASIDKAYSLIGQSMDCTALVSYALAARGINFHGWPEEYANVPGGQIVTDGSLQPGDILIYASTGGWNGGAHYDHVALYVGNGQAVHGGWNGYTVALAGAMLNQVTIVVRIP